MDKRLICIGGGELKSKETLKIDEYIATEVKKKAPGRRPYGLFIPTASHDSMPYFNSFRKTYTSVFDIKADVALTVHGEMSIEKISEKFAKADFLYIGGGDTIFMVRHWKETGLFDLIRAAYDRGVLICGLSAGAICWFEKMYTDSAQLEGNTVYSLVSGLNWVKGTISPHYNLRALDFNEIILYNREDAVALEDLSAIEVVNGEIVHSFSFGGRAYRISSEGGKLIKQVVAPEIIL